MYMVKIYLTANGVNYINKYYLERNIANQFTVSRSSYEDDKIELEATTKLDSEEQIIKILTQSIDGIFSKYEARVYLLSIRLEDYTLYKLCSKEGERI